ncbi:MAG: class I SAM-dependent rRNA methyltransferase [Chloroflexi bacterium]|jgi:23S rRNA (cytosine1962-C5)-methyltransferase|nr:class I SAM-dependent rRNA methyltransferase [Chloroflexota bacterium]MBT3668767.1 class I SAM-dependent rRNA methyltransferase [Chloroflexota bacterium]MBT4003230.1 class I SAM-dependent rRNA methyltransferase [Chloroflexota bacterium]MBT4305468.1 class I SAM-dependent rRNA methyltransferase [Chloroflexota bacterium]MBT4533079.1 class I SAM-dependent rRNA methyltransferase [Chloroflexota bacterium]
MLISKDWKEYQLLDSGKGQKLEQFGPHRLVRPEPRAVWKKAWGEEEWQSAVASFIAAEKGGGGRWEFHKKFDHQWKLNYKALNFWVEVEASKQIGVFPENAVHWDWIGEQITKSKGPLKILNLFGYTGLASLAAANAGAEVTHVDSSKRAVRIGKENQELSGLGSAKIRWIVDDVLKFIQREARRGNTYDGVIMDPPKYGLGPNKERWEFFKQYAVLCAQIHEILSDTPKFVVITAYALESPPEVLAEDMERMMRRMGGSFDYGELITEEKSAGRRLSNSIYARWQK